MPCSLQGFSRQKKSQPLSLAFSRQKKSHTAFAVQQKISEDFCLWFLPCKYRLAAPFCGSIWMRVEAIPDAIPITYCQTLLMEESSGCINQIFVPSSPKCVPYFEEALVYMHT